LEGVLWGLRSVATWRHLPRVYPSPSTCCRRLKLWEGRIVWLDVWRKFLSEFDEKSFLDWEEAFIQGTFAPEKKEGTCIGTAKRGKGSKWMVAVEGKDIPFWKRHYLNAPGGGNSC